MSVFFYLLLRVVSIALSTNYRFVYNNMYVACLFVSLPVGDQLDARFFKYIIRLF